MLITVLLLIWRQFSSLAISQRLECTSQWLMNFESNRFQSNSIAKPMEFIGCQCTIGKIRSQRLHRALRVLVFFHSVCKPFRLNCSTEALEECKNLLQLFGYKSNKFKKTLSIAQKTAWTTGRNFEGNSVKLPHIAHLSDGKPLAARQLGVTSSRGDEGATGVEKTIKRERERLGASRI